MVRSTGLEDRVGLSNAGGNESVTSVMPNLQAIWRAMGKVVRSYLSKKSLAQRLASGDDITQDPFMPVLIQIMIGEPVWDEQNPPTDLKTIPISGVMFSPEPEGNTAGVVQIQAAYGHNEGVVNSLVAVDTYYVGPSNVIHPIIRKKPKRLVSEQDNRGGYRLDFVDNYLKTDEQKDRSMQKKSILDVDLVVALKTIATEIEKFYDYPADIEFVVLNNTIYLVQTRPLNPPTQILPPPTYLADDYVENKKENVLRGSSIGVAGGSVRVVEDISQLIIQDTLPQALNLYNESRKEETGKSEVVVVKETASSTYK